MIYQFSVFFLNKNDENNENPFCGHCVGKYDPSTELPRDFCAGIGPLQLGVVLVRDIFRYHKEGMIYLIII